MKALLSELLTQAVQQLQANGLLPEDARYRITIDASKDKSHGDFASNLAMMLAKQAGRPPRELAQQLCDALPAHEQVANTEVAGPGFINFFMAAGAAHGVIRQVLKEGNCYGRGQPQQKQIQVEFVSANPTGPLHVGHGRGAAYGASLSNLLEADGYQVAREYYVNDAGRQMNILATSVWLRYLQAQGETLPFPSNGYKGDYIQDIAAQLGAQQGDAMRMSAAQVMADIPADEAEGGDKETHIDALIQRCKTLLGDAAYQTLFDLSLNAILDDIRDDLGGFGVNYAHWFSERGLTDSGDVDAAIDALQAAGHLYEKDGALWFRSTDFGDDKDRVVKRDNGETTYFASDIAYHKNKFDRGFDEVVNVWGADHHGYIARVKAALQALGLDAERLTVKLVQFAILYRGEERVQMSTRSGSFVTLRELREEVGNDAARYFYTMRKADQHMDFDLELAKSESKDNPVYYIQYAHARICSMREKVQQQYGYDQAAALAALEHLQLEQEKELSTWLSRYPEVISKAATALEPHQICNYLRELAAVFHNYYNLPEAKVLTDDAPLRNARMVLSEAVAQVLKNGLTLLGVAAPQQM